MADSKLTAPELANSGQNMAQRFSSSKCKQGGIWQLKKGVVKIIINKINQSNHPHGHNLRVMLYHIEWFVNKKKRYVAGKWSMLTRYHLVVYIYWENHSIQLCTNYKRHHFKVCGLYYWYGQEVKTVWQWFWTTQATHKIKEYSWVPNTITQNAFIQQKLTGFNRTAILGQCHGYQHI